MIFWQAFLTSLKLPQKKAMFRLNRIGMDVVVVYMFILLLIVSIPALIQQIQDAYLLNVHVEFFFLIIYFFMFYYLPLTIVVFLLLSLIAYIGKGIAHLMQRRLHFSILWKMAAFTTTIPFLLYTIVALIVPISDKILWLALVYALALLVKIISVYPRIRNRT